MTQAELAAIAERWRTRVNPDGTPVYDDYRTVTVFNFSRKAMNDACVLADAFVAGTLEKRQSESPSIDGVEVPGEQD